MGNTPPDSQQQVMTPEVQHMHAIILSSDTAVLLHIEHINKKIRIETEAGDKEKRKPEMQI